MHQHTINASLQLVPLAQDRHPYAWVDAAIEIIRQSGIYFEVGPFATVVEGSYEEVMQVIQQINDDLLHRGCTEWMVTIQLQIRSKSPITGIEKIEKYR